MLRQNFHYSKYINIYYSVFGVVPVFSVERQQLYEVKWYRLLVMAHLSVATLVAAQGFTQRINYITASTTENKRIFIMWEFILVTNSYLGIFGMLFKSVARTDQWEQLFRAISTLECHLDLPPSKKQRVWLIFILKLFFKYAVLVPDYFIWITVDPLFFILYRGMLFFFHGTFGYLFWEFVDILAFECDKIDSELKRSKAGPLKMSLKRIRRCRKLFFNMQIIMGLINRIFGNLLPFFYGYFWARSILLASVTYHLYSSKSYFDHGFDFKYLESFCINFAKMFIPWVIAYRCDKAIKDSEKLISTCQDLMKNESGFSEKRQELQDFVEQLKIKRVKFTLFRVTEINKKLIFQHIGAITSYFIVIVQFFNLNQPKNSGAPVCNCTAI